MIGERSDAGVEDSQLPLDHLGSSDCRVGVEAEPLGESDEEGERRFGSRVHLVVELQHHPSTSDRNSATSVGRFHHDFHRLAILRTMSFTLPHVVCGTHWGHR